MLTNQSPRILTGAAGFGAETSAVRTIAQGQFFAIQNFIPMQIGNGDFRGRDQIHIHPFQLEHILRKFRQLSRAQHTVLIHNKRREELSITVFCRMQIQIEINHAAFQAGAKTLIDSKTSAGDFMTSFKI